jgi:hypothetical protein
MPLTTPRCRETGARRLCKTTAGACYSLFRNAAYEEVNKQALERSKERRAGRQKRAQDGMKNGMQACILNQTEILPA